MTTTMQRAHFIASLSEALVSFFDDQLGESESFTLFRKKKVMLGSESVGKALVSLVLMDVQTEGRSTDSPHVEREEERPDGVYIAVERSPWRYALQFGLIGQPLHTTQGMKLSGQLQSILFDHPLLPVNYLEAQKVGFLGKVELRPIPQPSLDWERKIITDSSNGLLGAMNVQFHFSTGTAISEEKQVTRRKLSVGNRNQNT